MKQLKVLHNQSLYNYGMVDLQTKSCEENRRQKG